MKLHFYIPSRNIGGEEESNERKKNMIGQQNKYSNLDLTKPSRKQTPGVFQGWKRYEEAEEEEYKFLFSNLKLPNTMPLGKG